MIQTLRARMGTGGNNEPLVMEGDDMGMLVRRLTPGECMQLQGYPADWCDIEGATDSKKYKAAGNSIAIPQWWWLFNRLKPYMPENPKLGSMFAGIGGFDYAFEELFGSGSSRWMSEIEDFPIRVCKHHFGDEDAVD